MWLLPTGRVGPLYLPELFVKTGRALHSLPAGHVVIKAVAVGYYYNATLRVAFLGTNTTHTSELRCVCKWTLRAVRSGGIIKSIQHVNTSRALSPHTHRALVCQQVLKQFGFFKIINKFIFPPRPFIVAVNLCNFGPMCCGSKCAGAPVLHFPFLSAQK